MSALANPAAASRSGAWASPADSIVDITDLKKSFGQMDALQGLTLSLPRGSIIGLVGRNGAGKTTLMRHISGLMLPTSGRVVTLGRSAADLGASELSRIGALDQNPKLLGWLTVRQHLAYISNYYRAWDHDFERRLLTQFELSDQVRVESLSGGDRQKLALILTLCHRPELLLLDEPMTGLDPVVRERVLECLLELARENASTVVISTHVLHDIEKIVDWIVCLDRGRLVIDGAADEIQERFSEWIFPAPPSQKPKDVRRYYEPFIASQRLIGGQMHMVVRDGEKELEAFQRKYALEIMTRPLSLEKVLLHLLGDE